MHTHVRALHAAAALPVPASPALKSQTHQSAGNCRVPHCCPKMAVASSGVQAQTAESALQVLPGQAPCCHEEARGRAGRCRAAQDPAEPQPQAVHVRRHRQAALSGLVHQGEHAWFNLGPHHSCPRKYGYIKRLVSLCNGQPMLLCKSFYYFAEQALLNIVQCALICCRRV